MKCSFLTWLHLLPITSSCLFFINLVLLVTTRHSPVWGMITPPGLLISEWCPDIEIQTCLRTWSPWILICEPNCPPLLGPQTQTSPPVLPAVNRSHNVDCWFYKFLSRSFFNIWSVPSWWSYHWYSNLNVRLHNQQHWVCINFKLVLMPQSLPDRFT